MTGATAPRLRAASALAALLLACCAAEPPPRRVEAPRRAVEPAPTAPVARPVRPPRPAEPVARGEAVHATGAETAAALVGLPPEVEAPSQDPAQRRASLVRGNPWLTRFWAELDAAQRERVARALALRGTAGPPEAAWDPMGLGDRVALLYGQAS